MIDFKYTSEIDGIIDFVNLNGEKVISYKIQDLEKYVEDNHMNLYYVTNGEGGTGMVCDPNTNLWEEEKYTPVSEWLDDQDNFVSACELFYKHKNPHEFKSFNREQETIRRVG